MKPNFEDMTKAQLRAYVLQHRDDLDALEALFSRRRSGAAAIAFDIPQSKEEEQQQFELFKQLIDQKDGHSDSAP